MGLLLKLLVLSVSISYGIKYIGPLLPIQADNFNALLGVLVVPAIMTVLLWLRGFKKIESGG